MQTSIDLSSSLGVVQTNSITSTGKIINQDLEPCIKEATKRSAEDKMFRKNNQIKDA